MRADDVPLWINHVTGDIIRCAIEVHRVVGPGLLERPYRLFLAHELRESGLAVAEEVAVPVRYKGVSLAVGLRADIVVERTVVVEIKAVDALHPRHEAQLMTYLRLTGCPVGLLFNFGAKRLRDDMLRRVCAENLSSG